MKTLIENGVIVNERQSFEGSLLIDGEDIAQVLRKGQRPEATVDKTIDASGCHVLPGVIDTHVHFRQPGLTDRADIDSESRAAAAGGVTTFFDMPNTVPQTTTLEALADKHRMAEHSSHVNYSFFFGATADNVSLFDRLDPHLTPGIKLFMGSSTGNMLVDGGPALDDIFRHAPLPLVTHCEDTSVIDANMARWKERLATDDPDVRLHPLIRSEEACLASTCRAIELAVKHDTRLHIAHVSTACEARLLPADCLHTITAEATVGHLTFSVADYRQLGARIKVNPAIKGIADQAELRRAIVDGRISTVATDHAPHLLGQKQGGCARAASGMPMIQFSLVSMLELVDQGVLTLERLTELMAHNPATIFDVSRRGFLRPGYKADIAIVRRVEPWTLTSHEVLSKCGWSPLEGRTFHWRVEKTLCNGHTVYADNVVDSTYVGQSVRFR